VSPAGKSPAGVVLREPHDNEYGRFKVLRRTDGKFVVHDTEQWPPKGSVHDTEGEARSHAIQASGHRTGDLAGGVRVALTLGELEAADEIAKLRQGENAVGRRDRYGAGKNGLATHIIGSRCEAAVAKLLGIRYAKGVLRAGDVGRYRVRGSDKLSYSLTLHKDDPDDAVFILAIGPVGRENQSSLVYAVHGWIYGRDGKKPDYWRTGGVRFPAFFVPRSALHPMEELPRERSKHRKEEVQQERRVEDRVSAEPGQAAPDNAAGDRAGG
jgi:hypothetical protein